MNSKKIKKLFRNPSQFFVDAIKKRKNLSRLVQRLTRGCFPGNRRMAYWGALLSDSIEDFDMIIAMAGDQPERRRRYLLKRADFHARNHRKDLAVADVKKAVALKPDLKSYERLMELQKAISPAWEQIETMRDCLNFAPDQARLHAELGRKNIYMRRFDEAVENLENAVRLDPRHDDWQYWLACAHRQLHGGAKPARLLYSYLLGKENPRNARLGEGYLHQKNGRWTEAAEAYADQLKQDPDNRFLAYTLGRAQAHCFNWAAAAQAYRAALAGDVASDGAEAPDDGAGEGLNPDQAEAAEHQPGQDSQGEQPVQDEASPLPGLEDAADESAALKPVETAECYYNLGLALERLGQPAPAADSYRRAMARHPDQPREGYFFRLASVLTDLGEFQTACEIFVKSLFSAAPVLKNDKIKKSRPEELLRMMKDKTSPEGHYISGQLSELQGDWEEAAHCYRAAVDRMPKHISEWHYRLGLALYHLGRYQEACRAFRDIRLIYKRPTLASLPKKLSPQTLNSYAYVEALATLPIRDNVILYESSHGRHMGCNPYAIFRYLLDHPDYSDFIHVWALNDLGAMPQQYRQRDNVIFVPYKSQLYFRYLATAKYLVNNTSFLVEFLRRPEQKYLITWHGTPLKVLGRDLSNAFLPHANVGRNFLQATHFIHPCAFTREKLLRMSEVDELITGQVAETGYPRVDVMLKATRQEKELWRSRLNLSGRQPVILYAPTWRGDVNASLAGIDFNLNRCLSDLRELAKLPAQVVFRGHQLIAELLAGQDLPVTVTPPDMDAAESLAITDILITDYSSIFFDFLPARKPIVFYAYDLDDYCRQRGETGFYLPLEDMPGSICRNMDELTRTLNRLLTEPYVPDERHESGIEKFCPHEDGRSTQRAVDFFFHDRTDRVVDVRTPERRSVLVRVGNFIPNGITASFLSLAGKLDREKNRLALLVEPSNMTHYPERIEKFNEFSRQGAQLVFKVGAMLRSMEEKMVEDLTKSDFALNASPEVRRIKREIYDREMVRIAGYTKFDDLINFDGYGEFWAALMAYPHYPAKHLIYQHNDMLAELRARFPQLEVLFSCYYHQYDRLVSVSEGVMESNRENLSSAYGLAENLFTYANNTLDTAEILRKSAEPAEDWFGSFVGGRACFINLGRLSPEKGHDRLIQAFAAVHLAYPETCLVIVGGGPLEAKLSGLIDELGLPGSVKLAGYQANPYPLLKAADCFVLSSNYEGQGLVLLESMILNRPIITTDLPPTRSVMELDGGGYGLLVDNSVDGLIKGMKSFMDKGLTPKAFNVDAYNQEALRKFESLL